MKHNKNACPEFQNSLVVPVKSNKRQRLTQDRKNKINGLHNYQRHFLPEQTHIHIVETNRARNHPTQGFLTANFHFSLFILLHNTKLVHLF